MFQIAELSRSKEAIKDKPVIIDLAVKIQTGTKPMFNLIGSASGKGVAALCGPVITDLTGDPDIVGFLFQS